MIFRFCISHLHCLSLTVNPYAKCGQSYAAHGCSLFVVVSLNQCIKISLLSFKVKFSKSSYPLALYT